VFSSHLYAPEGAARQYKGQIGVDTNIHLADPDPGTDWHDNAGFWLDGAGGLSR
jgi:hypothetical protein